MADKHCVEVSDDVSDTERLISVERSLKDSIAEVATLTAELKWIYQRSREGLFSLKRSVRDRALSDINYRAEKYSS